MLEEIKKLPKIELHLHLDGSVSLEVASKLTNIKKEELKDKMIVKDECKSLTEYLTKFPFPISLMQTKENLELIAYDLVNRLEKENIIYAEIRFAPICHTLEGLSLESVVESVLKGLNKNKKVKTKLILCMKREASKKDNLEVIKLAGKYLDKGVGGIDLAGDEIKYKLDNYKDLFLYAKLKNIPFTIHVGETSSRDIKTAIKLGTKRFGHGVKIIENKELIKLVKKNNILLEICPTSNIQTNVFDEYYNHPIYKLYKDKVNISINTDNMTISNIDLNQEYLKLLNNFSLTIEDLKEININSLNYAFITPEEKLELLEILKR